MDAPQQIKVIISSKIGCDPGVNRHVNRTSIKAAVSRRNYILVKRDSRLTISGTRDEGWEPLRKPDES